MTYEQVKERLRDGISNTIEQNTRIIKGVEPKTYDITFHHRTIIRFYPNGDQRFWSSGKQSYTLWDRIIKFSDSVVPTKDTAIGEITLFKNGQEYNFTEGVLIEA